MPSKINRRSFLRSSSGVLGSLLFSRTAAGNLLSPGNDRRGKLIATTDYYDNILVNGSFFNRSRLDELHQYLASLGVTRHQWIVDTIWNFYDGDRQDFDLLAEAVQSAHRHGIELYAEIKPFEGGGFGELFPSSFPLTKGSVALADIRGIYPIARPFVAANPHLCLRRRPGTFQRHAPVSRINLVKRDDGPTRIRREHLTIWTSSANNGFTEYKGPVTFTESVEWRPTAPTSRLCRILSLQDLELPASHDYILIQCSPATGRGDFTNERGSIIELPASDGTRIPFIVSTGRIGFTEQADFFHHRMTNRIVRYFAEAGVAEIFRDRNAEERHYLDYHGFEESRKITEPYTLDERGFIAIACGKPEYMLGNLHPIYPEVREHWLDMMKHCLDRGVDGINIRHSNHTRSPEEWDYGFNEPVLRATGGKTDYPSVSRVNGDAYTLFLREARDLIRKYGKALTLHLYAQFLLPDDRAEHLSYIPPNFEWQWQTWVREIADDLEFRGAWTLRPWNLRKALEIFSDVTTAAGKPLYYQGNMKELGYAGPYDFTTGELKMMREHPGLNGFVLYETAHFTRADAATGVIEGSRELREILQK